MSLVCIFLSFVFGCFFFFWVGSMLSPFDFHFCAILVRPSSVKEWTVNQSYGWGRIKNGKTFLIFWKCSQHILFVNNSVFFRLVCVSLTKTEPQTDRDTRKKNTHTHTGLIFSNFEQWTKNLHIKFFFFFLQSRLWLAVLTEENNIRSSHCIDATNNFPSNEMKSIICINCSICSIGTVCPVYGLSLQWTVYNWKTVMNNEIVGELKYSCANRCLNVQFKHVHIQMRYEV